jgi:hypothetical protein
MSKRNITRPLPSGTLTLLSGGRAENQPAYSIFGPVKAGLTTTQRTNEDHQLTELLNSLEKKLATLLFRSSEVLDTFENGTTHLVEPTTSISDTTTTDVISLA